MRRLKEELVRLEVQPLPTKKDAELLWREVQRAVAAYLPVQFAEAYRTMERGKVLEKMRLRALAVQHKMQQERINALRGSLGLHHLKKLGLGRGRQRTKFLEHLARRRAIAASPPPPSA